MHISSNGSGGGVGHGKYKEIYDLLEKLCKIHFRSPQKQRDVLRRITHYISNCPTSVATVLPFNEFSLRTHIVRHLNEYDSTVVAPLNYTSATTIGTGGVGDSGSLDAVGSQGSATKFFTLHNQLKTQLGDRQRNALLTFLYFMADPKNPPSTNYSRTRSVDPMTYNPSYQRQHSTSPVRNSQFHALRSQYTPQDEIGGSNANSGARHRISSSSTSTTATATYDLNAKFAAQKLSATQSSHSSGDAENTNNHNNVPLTPLMHNGDTERSLQEAQNLNEDIVQNVIYSFSGIQGTYLKKDIISGKFKLDPKAKTLTVVQAGMMLRLSELGYYHDQVQAYADKKKGLCALGLMGQGFISILRNEITKYYGMIAMLQEQLNIQRNVKPSRAPIGGTTMISTKRREQLTLMKLLAWSMDPLQRLEWLSNIASECQEKKGGALASIVHSFLYNGSPMVKSLVTDLLLAICGPLYQMLTYWLLEGEIRDPHGEFFIECLNEVGPDRLWYDKYRVRTSMLPDFISSELAHKILVTGKSIKFLWEICKDKEPVKGRDELRECIENNPEHIFAVVPDTKLHSTIDAIYLNTSRRVLDIVKGPHKLLDHLQALRRYLLMGQGDFIGILMENLKFELNKPARQLYSYDLSTIMDAAVRSTNAQYDDPEILNHLDVRLLTPCDGDIGWDILSLQYTVRGPLATMLEPSMGVYQVLFKPLWRMKHMEFVLSSKIWKDQMCNAKPLRPMSAELNQVLYRLNLFTSEMIHFIHQMQYYILFEVIECSWVELQKRVEQAMALDDILNAHNDFLNAIKVGAFLDHDSRELSLNMDSVYEGIVHLEVWQDKFFELCFKELKARKQYDADVLQSEKEGEFGVTSEKQLQRSEERKIFEQTLHSYHKSLENIGSNYEKAVRSFLFTLNSNNNHNLLLFGTRLDFNEYYKKRDQRLGVPLTFEHMRLSNILFNSANKSMHGSRYSQVN